MSKMVSSPSGVSVIIPFYRELDLIAGAVASVEENFSGALPYEIMICNDGELTEQVIRDATEHEESGRLKILRNEFQKGPGGARNTGLKYAKYDIVAFLDADDIWFSGKLDKQLDCYMDGANFIATDYILDNGLIITAPTEIKSPEDIFLKRGLGTSTIFVSRDLIGDSRFRDLRYGQDIDFWYRLAKKSSFSFNRVPSVGVRYFTGGSTSNKLVQLWHMCRVLRVNSVTSHVFFRFLYSYVISGVFNHYGFSLLTKLKRKIDVIGPD